MDLNSKFQRTFYPLQFESFKIFYNRLDRFQKENGIIYTVRSADSIQENSELHRKLVYNRIHFVCSHHNPEPIGKAENPINCSSYIILQRSRNILKIGSYCMQHSDLYVATSISNENDEIEKYELTGYDLSREFTRFFSSHEFSSFEELSARLRQFELATGALYVKLNSRRLLESHPMRDSLIYSNVKYVCYHYGTCVSSATKRVNQKTSKLGCSSQFYLNYSNGCLRITSYDMRHNHPVAPDSAKMYPRNRRLEEHEQKFVDELLRRSYDNSLIVEIIKKQFGKHCTIADVKNMRVRLRRQTDNSQVDLKVEDNKDTLDSILQEIREVAETSSEELLTQNIAVLRDVLSAWKQGRLATPSETRSLPEPNSSSYQNVFTDDPNDIMIEYNSPTYLLPNDTQ